MQAFKFRLESVLRYQEKQKKLAKLRWQQALQTLLNIEREIDRLQKELRRIAGSLQQFLGRSDTQKQWESLHAQSRWLANVLSAAEQKAVPARANHAQAHELYRKIASLVEALREIKQRRWHEYKNAAERVEQQRIEEFVLRRWAEVPVTAQDDLSRKEAL